MVISFDEWLFEEFLNESFDSPTKLVHDFSRSAEESENEGKDVDFYNGFESGHPVSIHSIVDHKKREAEVHISTKPDEHDDTQTFNPKLLTGHIVKSVGVGSLMKIFAAAVHTISTHVHNGYVGRITASDIVKHKSTDDKEVDPMKKINTYHKIAKHATKRFIGDCDISDIHSSFSEKEQANIHTFTIKKK